MNKAIKAIDQWIDRMSDLVVLILAVPVSKISDHLENISYALYALLFWIVTLICLMVIYGEKFSLPFVVSAFAFVVLFILFLESGLYKRKIIGTCISGFFVIIFTLLYLIPAYIPSIFYWLYWLYKKVISLKTKVGLGCI